MAKVLKGDFPRSRETAQSPQSEKRVIPAYELKVAVAFSDPLIYRVLRVPGTMTLATLHEAIQVCMGWDDSDTHQFLVGKIFYQSGFGIRNMKRDVEYDEKNFQLHQLEEGMQFLFTYLYDGGEGWELEITLERIIAEGCAHHYALLIGGEQACPPVEVGDIHSYQLLLSREENGSERPSISIPGNQDFRPDEFDDVKIKQLLEKI